MARKGLPKKYAKMGFKKGWAEYKKARRSAARKRTSGSPASRPAARAAARTSGTAKKKTTTKRTGRPVAVKKTTRTAARTSKRTGRPTMKRLQKNTLDALLNGALVGGGALVSSVAVNQIPVVKTQAPWIKSLANVAIGLGLVTMVKNPMVKKVGSGFIAGAAIEQLKPLISGFGLTMGAREFNAAELAELQTGRPVNAAMLGKPVDVTRKGLSTGYSRGKRAYTR